MSSIEILQFEILKGHFQQAVHHHIHKHTHTHTFPLTHPPSKCHKQKTQFEAPVFQCSLKYV